VTRLNATTNPGSGELDSVKAALSEATRYARHLERELAAKEAALAQAGDYARSLEMSLRCNAMAQADLAAKRRLSNVRQLGSYRDQFTLWSTVCEIW
jgi:hypothetical protein